MPSIDGTRGTAVRAKGNKKPATTLEFTLSRHSILARLPKVVLPYIEITRMHIPPINLVCFSPFAVGLAYAARATCLPWPDLLAHAAAAYVPAFLAGCAGHTLDDCWDYSIDCEYERCQSRPIVRGDISLRAAFIFTAVIQSLFLIAVHQIYGAAFMSYGFACVILFSVYPLSKRFWNYPQLVIGILHAIPIPWMAASLGINLWEHISFWAYDVEDTRRSIGVGATYIAFALSTVIFDTGYGLLDVKEDMKYGVGSMSVRFKTRIHTLLWSLGAVLVSCLVIAGQVSGFGGIYLAGCATIAGHLAYMISGLEADNPKSAIAFFMSVNTIIPAQTIGSLLADYVYSCYF